MSHWKVTDEATQKEVFRGPTCESAEDWIADIEKFEPLKVHDGGYGIDGPCPDPGETIMSEGGELITG